ncbi:polysaccharide deacetylase family protein [Flavobacterium paronense]|uniref:Polysaccharide deacetylase family protein n=1 Tax=Flavobacterium paronense TaxID=1392775 RepID=A0ABV5GAU7_9FLAO|nr:polysaccharide deacetylase family protein [Flavobacterium paronense]MDN3676717.1 polysaccharide deacetylase family protein [Flavobacterium paronense]
MLTVSNYHYIREDFSAPFPSIFGITPNQFENQLVELSKLGEFISQQKLIQEIDAILSSDLNYILITFDDGLKEQFEIAKPILDKLNIPAIYFVNSLNYIEKKVSLVHKIHLLRSRISSKAILNCIQNEFSSEVIHLTTTEKNKAELHYNYDDKESAHLKYLLNFKLSSDQTTKVIDTLFFLNFDTNEVVSNLYMSADQLQELSRMNMLGSHTHSHFALGLLASDEIATEIATTKEFIDNFEHDNQHAISYAYGSAEACQNPVQTIAKQHGYTIGFTMERGINDFTANKLLLKRFDCNDLPGGKNYTK